jgi:hypothetical protein
MMPTRVTDLTPSVEAARRYADKWKAMREIGHKPVILSAREYPNEWRKWRSYFRAHGLLASLDLMNDGRNQITVPTLDPFQFDHPEPLQERRYKED